MNARLEEPPDEDVEGHEDQGEGEDCLCTDCGDYAGSEEGPYGRLCRDCEIDAHKSHLADEAYDRWKDGD